MDQLTLRPLGRFTACEGLALQALTGQPFPVLDALGFASTKIGDHAVLVRTGFAVLKARELIYSDVSDVNQQVLSPIGLQVVAALSAGSGLSVAAETENAVSFVCISSGDPSLVLEPVDNDLFSVSVSSMAGAAETAQALVNVLRAERTVQRVVYAPLVPAGGRVIVDDGARRFLALGSESTLDLDDAQFEATLHRLGSIADNNSENETNTSWFRTR